MDAEGSRQLLGRLLRGARAKRDMRLLWQMFNNAIVAKGELAISYTAFLGWFEGETFPATRVRQEALADVIGGAVGEAIRTMKPPPFRGFRRVVMKGDEKMGHGNHTARREMPTELVKGEDGLTTRQAVIVCVQCGGRAHHLRRSMTESVDYFAKGGWLVGKGPEGDKCPDCRKVIKMEKPKQEQEQVERKLTGSDRVLISMKVADAFDEERGCYKAGWSDHVVARELDRPLDWVVAEREHLYPGSKGDDPDAAWMVEQLASLKAAMPSFSSRLDQLSKTVASTDALLAQVAEQQRVARIEASKLVEEGNKLERVVKAVQQRERPFLKAAG